MLEELLITDYALIDELTVCFSDGFNVLTGETGAGKSIIVGSLDFLLGGRADADAIRTGAEEASVSAIISIASTNTEALEWLETHDIEIDDGRINLRRVLKAGGRSSSYVQGVPVARAELAMLTAVLFDIHGQHEHQSLMKTDIHRQYLDAFAGIVEDVSTYSRLFQEVSELRKSLEEMRQEEKGRAERLELLTFGIQEIDAANVRRGESEELEAEAHRLASYEKLAIIVNAAAAHSFDGEAAALDSLRKVKAQLEQAISIDESLSGISRRFSDLYYEYEDACDQLRSYQEKLVYDPARLEEIEERLAALFKLKKKYGAHEDEILSWRQEAEREYEALEHMDADRSRLESSLANKERELVSRAGALSAARKEASERLSAQITQILRRLGMSKAQFAVSMLDKTKGNDHRVFGQSGADDIEFLVSANQGEPAKPLRKVASGGELSRLMLAIKTVLAAADSVETMVFDEIDTGIGGEVALAVADQLAELGTQKQIFCITHLATIAVRADNHVKVSKKVEGERTFTVIETLDTVARREEIARMLSGDAIAQAALAHADELLARYQP